MSVFPDQFVDVNKLVSFVILHPFLIPDTIHLGDCRDLLAQLLDAQASGFSPLLDSCVTDPPYGIDYQSNRRVARPQLPKFKNDVDLNWLDPWVEQIYRVLKPDSHFYCFTRFDVYPTFYNSMSRFFKVKNCLIWLKNNHGCGDLNGSYAPQYEMIIFAVKGRRALNGPRDSDVLACDNVPSADRLHPTQKPVELLRRLLRQSCPPGGIVLDPFAGSGSTLLAAYLEGFHFLGFEKDPKWHAIALQRLSAARSQQRLL